MQEKLIKFYTDPKVTKDDEEMKFQSKVLKIQKGLEQIEEYKQS